MPPKPARISPLSPSKCWSRRRSTRSLTKASRTSSKTGRSSRLSSKGSTSPPATTHHDSDETPAIRRNGAHWIAGIFLSPCEEPLREPCVTTHGLNSAGALKEHAIHQRPESCCPH